MPRVSKFLEWAVGWVYAACVRLGVTVARGNGRAGVPARRIAGVGWVAMARGAAGRRTEGWRLDDLPGARRAESGLDADGGASRAARWGAGRSGAGGWGTAKAPVLQRARRFSNSAKRTAMRRRVRWSRSTDRT